MAHPLNHMRDRLTIAIEDMHTYMPADICRRIYSPVELARGRIIPALKCPDCGSGAPCDSDNRPICNCGA